MNWPTSPQTFPSCGSRSARCPARSPRAVCGNWITSNHSGHDLPLLAFALVLGAILGSLAQYLVVWTAALLIPLTLLLPLALGSARRRRRR